MVVYPEIKTRNLLYHVAPFAGNGFWQHNVAQLRKRINMFNGKRVVAILTGAEFDKPATVKDLFAVDGIEFIEMRNDPRLREVHTFLPLFGRVATHDPHEVTFYGHAKGVTRPRAHTAHLWADLMYELYLDYWPFIEKLLLQHPLAGAFKKVGQAWPRHETRSMWHYSGSFLWFRNSALFSKPNWQKIDRFWSGIESYPAIHFRKEEAACIFHERPSDVMQLYPTPEKNKITGWRYVADIVLPELMQWRVKHVKDWKTW